MAGRLSQAPPIAARRANTARTNFGDNVSDPYAWLRDDARSSKEVLAYLEAENNYADAYFRQLQPLVDSVADSMDAAAPAVEVSQPILQGGHLYYRKRGPSDDYWNTYRLPLHQQQQQQQQYKAAPDPAGQAVANLAGAVQAAAAAVQAAAAAAASPSGSPDSRYHQEGSQTPKPPQQQQQQGLAAEQLVLDENSLSAGHSYWDVYEKEVSPDGSKLAFTYDTVGNECYSLQVLDIATGKPLLQPPVINCAGGIAWWRQDSHTLLYTAEDRSSPDRSRLLVMALNLQQQQQHKQQQQQSLNERAVLLYQPEEDETGLSMKRSCDGQFILLTSSLEGATQVQALPTSYPLKFSSSSSSSGSPAVPLSAWQLLISPDDDLDVLSIDHVGPIGSSSSSSESSSTSRAHSKVPGSGDSSSSSSSSKGMGCFIAIVDDDESPDGELVIISANLGQGNGSNIGQASSSNFDAAAAPQERIVSLVRNRLPEQAYSSDSDDESQHAQQQQQQQGKAQVQSLEILSFQVHAAAGYLAVAVRRQGVCAVDIYKLQNSGGSSSSSGVAALPGVGSQSGADAAEVTVPAVLLVTNSSSQACPESSSSSSNPNIDGSATAGPGPITVPNPGGAAGIAQLAWVLVLDDPTLVLDLEGLEGPADEPWLVVHVSGFTTPSALYYVQLKTQQQIQAYQESILGYHSGCYTAKLEWARSNDGTAVPVTLAYRTDLMKHDGSNAAILHGYGAYGSKQWPSFNPADLALLDRGLLLAVAHVRGGGELGSTWHVHGKKFSKKNTFHDFLAAAQHLVKSGYSSRQGLAVWGRSAGGLTVAASLNMDPGFARVAVLDVPFLDVVNTMQDPQLPLTIKERSEWGDPLNNEEAYRYIRSYSPYSNMQPAAAYPALLLTASLHDTRVNYWEPGKYTAAMRHNKRQQQQQQQEVQGQTGDGRSADSDGAVERPLLLMTDMHAGHFAASAASSRLQERAMKLAFILHNLGIESC